VIAYDVPPCRLGSAKVADQARALRQPRGGASGRSALGSAVHAHVHQESLPHDADSWASDAAFFAGDRDDSYGGGGSGWREETYDHAREVKRRAEMEERAEALKGASLRKRVRTLLLQLFLLLRVCPHIRVFEAKGNVRGARCIWTSHMRAPGDATMLHMWIVDRALLRCWSVCPAVQVAQGAASEMLIAATPRPAPQRSALTDAKRTAATATVLRALESRQQTVMSAALAQRVVAAVDSWAAGSAAGDQLAYTREMMGLLAAARCGFAKVCAFMDTRGVFVTLECADA
jgi:hypothetical protein